MALDARPQIVRHNRVDHVLPVARVRVISGDQLPQGDPERINVRFGRHPLAFQQLRGAVRVRAADVTEERAGGAHLASALQFDGAAEIGDFAHVVARHQHVGGFYVQVHDVVGVKELQAARNVFGVAEPPVLPQRLRLFVDDLLQVSVAHELHEDRPSFALISEFCGDIGGGRDDAHDVPVAQVRGVQLGPEALPGRQLVLGAFLDFLQRDCFPEVLRFVDAAEPPGTHRLDGTQLLPVDHRGPQPAGDFAVEPLCGDLESGAMGMFGQWTAASPDVHRWVDAFGQQAGHRNWGRHRACQRITTLFSSPSSF